MGISSSSSINFIYFSTTSILNGLVTFWSTLLKVKSIKLFGFTTFNSESTYTNTISARYYKDGSEALIEQKNKNPRLLTPRECARLQGFPENFIIPVSNAQAYKQFGNSVCVKVVDEIAKNIISYLSTYKIIKGDL